MASTSDDGYVDITPLKDGGVLKKVLKEGVGVAKCPNGTTVTVHYTGTLENGEQFDSSRDRGKPFEFSLGKKQVINGWDVGVATMKKGEQAVFKIRSDYAYGDGGQPPSIPPKATLIFDVELIDWEAEDISPDKDKTILKTCIVDGEKLANPNDTSPVTVHVTGTYEGRVFYDKEVSFILGEASEVGLPEGVDKALKRFTKGEKSIIELKGTRFTYGANPPAEYNLPPNVPIQFTIFLKNYEKVPATWEMSTEDKLKCAREAKDRGTKFLQENKLKLALNKYKRVEDVLEYEKTTDPEPKAERDALLLAAYLNLALTASKMNEQTECVKWCDKALEMSENNVKALYRKGGAKLAMNDLDEAKQIYKKIIEVEPDNKAATQQLLVCDQKRREQLEKEKKRFKNLFSKLNDDDKGQPQAETSGDVNMADDDGAVPSTSGAAVQASA